MKKPPNLSFLRTDSIFECLGLGIFDKDIYITLQFLSMQEKNSKVGEQTTLLFHVN